MSADSEVPNIDDAHVRPGRSRDALSLRDLARDSYLQYVEAEGSEPEPMKTDYRAAIQRGETWVAELHDEIVGLLVLEPRSRYLVLDNIAVAKRLRGFGIGRLLMDWTESRALELGLSEIRLYTGAVMTQNRHYLRAPWLYRDPSCL